ncbi:MAG: polyphosphate kinase 2 [Wenzhouxiangella sp.]|jgi:polyphosphate kinase 2|nr:polyphosphate kinase 2 [Wenzhouxiangella sp.]
MQELSDNRRFGPEDYNAKGKLKKKVYVRELRRLQLELVKLQHSVVETGRRVVIVFEGRDAAGKGGVIKRITDMTNPRVVRTVALGVPSDREKTQWYFQRYVQHLPAAGEIVLFDRSWYNRPNVERVMGFATEEQVQRFMHSCPEFEDMLISDGIELIKYWFSVSEREQEARLKARVEDPAKRWKLSMMDIKARDHWADYSKAKDDMLKYTDTEVSPWYFVDADVKRHARLNCIADILRKVPYDDQPPPAPELPPRKWANDEDDRVRKPIESYVERLY